MKKSANRLLTAMCVLVLASPVAAKPVAIPHLVHHDGRYALMVDGQPYTMFGVQAHNSSDNEFIVVGQQVRLHFGTAGANAGKPATYLRVEEGRFDDAGKWIMERNWNGDQFDSGLNLPARPTVLKVRMGTD